MTTWPISVKKGTLCHNSSHHHTHRFFDPLGWCSTVGCDHKAHDAEIRLQKHTEPVSEQPAVSIITHRHGMGRRPLCPLRRSRRPLFVATRPERSRHEHSWRLVLNFSGPNAPKDQRSDFEDAKTNVARMYEEFKQHNTKIHPKDQVRQSPAQQFEGHQESDYRVEPSTGWK